MGLARRLLVLAVVAVLGWYFLPTGLVPTPESLGPLAEAGPWFGTLGSELRSLPAPFGTLAWLLGVGIMVLALLMLLGALLRVGLRLARALRESID